MKSGCARFSFLSAVLVLLAWGPSSVGAESIDHPVAFDRSDLVFSTFEGYDRVHLDGADLTFTPGEPELPVHLVHLALPGRAVVEAVTLVDAEWVPLPGQYRVAPVEQPFILSSDLLGIPMPERVGPAPAVYESDAVYPPRPAEFTGDGFMAGVHIAGIRVYPVRYSPLGGRLEFLERAVLRVTYGLSAEGGRFRAVERLDGQGVRRRVAGLVGNPEALPGLDLKVIDPLRPARDGESYDYLVITNAALLPHFQDLVDWKSRKGLRVKTVTMEEIDADYAGIEEAEARVRQCIIDAYANWGITWVLLAGDTGIVPARWAYAMDALQLPGHNRIYCDLYYSDLDGDWNADGDIRHGEVEDNIDLYADIYIGRLPAQNTAQADTLVDKLLTYERTPPLDYQVEMLMTGEIMWSDPYTDGGVGLDWIDETCVPPRFDPIQKLYQRLGNESKTSVMNALSDGRNYWLHDGHGNYNLLSVGNGTLYSSDMRYLTNGSRYTIGNSIACYPAAYDYTTCIGERFLTTSSGGGVAFIGNNRYGWGSPGNPKFGYSDRFQHRFFHDLFIEGVYQPGEVVALVKAYYAPQSRTENVYRWHQYQVTLLGDPEFNMWTRVPAALQVEHPDSHPLADGTFAVTVTDGGVPVENALVCVTDDGDLHEAGRTDAGGQVALAISPTVAGTVWVTVTAPDYLPYEGSAQILPSGPYAAVESFTLDDSAGGNGNGLVNRGETIGLTVTLHNPGTETATSVGGVLDSDDGMVTITDDTETFGDIPAGGSAPSLGTFTFSVGSGATAGHVCLFDLEVSSTSGGPWPAVIAVPVAAPVVDVAKLTVDDSGRGNGDYKIEPGESFDLFVDFRNLGTDLAAGTTVSVWTSSAWVSFGDSTAALGDVPVGEERTGEFAGGVDLGCPDPHFPVIYFEISTADGYSFLDSTLFVVGTTGFKDDMESGDALWTHGGVLDHWHLSSLRTHSGSWAWSSAREDTLAYEPNMDAQLTAPVVTLAPDPMLSMWLWHDVATYGVDGLYVILHRGAARDTLDFVGSGGALGLLNIGNDWLEFTYDLAYHGYGAGDEVQLILSFVSDDNLVLGEGFCVDDVVITGTLPEGVTDAPEPGLILPARTRLVGNWPNPFNPLTEIRYEIARGGPVELGVYDISGRLVSMLVSRPLPPGEYSVNWDGTDARGVSVASGVYFVRFVAPAHQSSAKIVLMK